MPDFHFSIDVVAVLLAIGAAVWYLSQIATTMKHIEKTIGLAAEKIETHATTLTAHSVVLADHTARLDAHHERLEHLEE